MSQSLHRSSRALPSASGTGPRGNALLPGGIGKTMLAVGMVSVASLGSPELMIEIEATAMVA